MHGLQEICCLETRANIYSTRFPKEPQASLLPGEETERRSKEIACRCGSTSVAGKWWSCCSKSISFSFFQRICPGCCCPQEEGPGLHHSISARGKGGTGWFGTEIQGENLWRTGLCFSCYHHVWETGRAGRARGSWSSSPGVWRCKSALPWCPRSTLPEATICLSVSTRGPLEVNRVRK